MCNVVDLRSGVSAVLTRFSIVVTVGLSVLAALLTRTVLMVKLLSFVYRTYSFWVHIKVSEPLSQCSLLHTDTRIQS